MAAALSAVRGALAGLSPREKRLLIALGAVFATIVFLGVYIFSSRRLDAIERDRADTVDALRLIQHARPRIAQRNLKRDQLMLLYATRAPALTSFVEEQAHAANIQVAEATDRTPTPVGRFTERSVSIRLRQVSLQALAEFMDHIDSATFPVAITQVRIRRRPGEVNRFDIDDMVISTWDHTPDPPRGGAARDGETRDNADRSAR